jgi:monooxygenase
MRDHHDVLIIGAGVSGIGMACHLARECPQLDVAIIERRSRIGGTWDLFRYPGIRSDSDMFSFGYAFRPWDGDKVLADGDSIREYVTQTAREYRVEEKVRPGLRALRADWSGSEALWTVTVADEAGRQTRLRARHVVSCSGYYNYDEGHQPDFPGQERFRGLRIHPQFWPEGLDYQGKRVVVIGSGATAVTIVPAMAAKAGRVTMLQRSPTYIFSVPATSRLSQVLRRILPRRVAFAISRWVFITLQRAIFRASRRWPQAARRFFMRGVEKRLAPGYDMSHFAPRYLPWDERLCAVPDDDLFEAIKAGKAEVVTGEIETFTEGGIRLRSGVEIPADIIVTATGLQLQALGGLQLSLDGQAYDPSRHLTYKAVLLEGLPNFGWIFGYTNASWTLKADIAAAYLCRLFKHLRDTGREVFVARAPREVVREGTVLGSLRSGYVRRAAHLLPQQGRDAPWHVTHDYPRDRAMLLREPIEDGVLRFESAAARRKAA